MGADLVEQIGRLVIVLMEVEIQGLLVDGLGHLFPGRAVSMSLPLLELNVILAGIGSDADIGNWRLGDIGIGNWRLGDIGIGNWRLADIGA